jgi:AcrR family transcriptional regulator
MTQRQAAEREPEQRTRRRQARGERRMAALLDAAAEVFAEAGYAAATTNAIAARAGVSPGSLYQYFRSKEDIAEALATRFIEQMAAEQDRILTRDLVELPLAEMVDRVIDPLVAFSLRHPAHHVLLAGPGAPQRLATAKQPLEAAALAQVDVILAGFASSLGEAERARLAQVAMQVFKGVMQLIVAADEAERPALIAELKRLLIGYFAPLDERAGPK